MTQAQALKGKDLNLVWRVRWKLPIDGPPVDIERFFSSESAALKFRENAVKSAESLGIKDFTSRCSCHPLEIKD
jgi:hypothetical protein